MKHALFIFLVSIAAASMALPQSAGTPKKTPSKTATKSSAKATSKKTTANTGAKTASTKTGRSGKKSVRTASAPAYRQQTPTPERYREIQQALADKGYLKSEPNGVWDAASVDAMSRFQADQKQQPTGKITSASLIGLGLGPKNGNEAAKPLEPSSAAPQSTPAAPVLADPPPAVRPEN